MALEKLLLKKKLESDTQRETTHNTTKPLPKFNLVFTTVPEVAAQTLLESALPATPVLVEAEVRLCYLNTHHSASAEGRQLIEGSESEISPIVLNILEKIAKRADFYGFEIRVDLSEYCKFARVNIQFKWGVGPAITLWRTVDGILIFSPHA
jgi:hypothetical protein